ncbi:MAG: response regulator [Acuticoccus sp.]
MSQPQILIVDDDETHARATGDFLASRNFGVQLANGAGEARQAAQQVEFDLFLLDIVMPGTSGKVLCCEFAATQRGGIIIISSLVGPAERISLIEMGADDYIEKPFEPLELLARIRAFFRRYRAAAQEPPATRFGPWQIGEHARIIQHEDGRVVTLTPAEARVLRHFLANPELALPRDEILAISRMRQHAGAQDRSVDNLVKRLRQKIEKEPTVPRHIETVWGKGYAFRLG